MKDGRWITINGRHIFIKDGQSPIDALIRQKVKNNKISNKKNSNKEVFEDSKGNKHEFEEVSPKNFKEQLDKMKDTRPDADKWRVDNTSHSIEDYINDKLYQSNNGSTLAITPDGDIISVCANANFKGEGRALMEFAVQHEGKKLDSYDGNFDFYTKMGFEPISWTPFNEEYAPDDWNKEFSKEPVVFFKYVGKPVKTTKEEFYKNVKPDAEYDDAMNKRDKTIRG